MTDAGHEQAFRLFLQHQPMLSAYVRAIVRDAALAEDALAETAIALSRSWTKYDPTLPFAPWARGVARRVAISALRRWHGGAPVVTLDPEALEQVGVELDAMLAEETARQRQEALRGCMASLSAAQRDLLGMRYTQGLAYADIAARVQRTSNAIMVTMHRIHHALGQCIRRRLATAP